MVQYWVYTFMAHSRLDRVLHQINGLKCVILRSKATPALSEVEGKNLVPKAENGMLRSAQHDKHFGERKSVNLFLPENEPSPSVKQKLPNYSPGYSNGPSLMGARGSSGRSRTGLRWISGQVYMPISTQNGPASTGRSKSAQVTK